MRRLAAWCLGPLRLLVAVTAVATAGVDDAPYARLLERHVRPGTVAGIRLALVDYAALRDDVDHYPVRSIKDGGSLLRAAADPGLGARLARLEAAGLGYLPYDWSLNDARRAGSP